MKVRKTTRTVTETYAVWVIKKSVVVVTDPPPIDNEPPPSTSLFAETTQEVEPCASLINPQVGDGLLYSWLRRFRRSR